MYNQYFPHLKDYIPEKHHPKANSIIRNLKKFEEEGTIITWHNDLNGKRYPVHICYPGRDFSPWMHLSDPIELMKFTYLSSIRTIKEDKPETWFRKDKGSPWSREDYNKTTSLNKNKRTETILTVNVEDPTEIVMRENTQFRSAKQNFNGEPIFPKPSTSVASLDI